MNQNKYFMDGYLKRNFDKLKTEAIPNNWDAVFIVFGREGTGKTTMASQCCDYLDGGRFDIDVCVFTTQQFEEAIENSPDESSILWDEAITGANVATHATKISSTIVSKMTQIRRKKMKIFLCFPYLDMLNKYFVKRCAGSFLIYAKSFKDRGYYKFYNAEKTRKIHYLMKEKYKYNPDMALKQVLPSFYNQFSNKLCLDKKQYDKKKDEALTTQTEDSDMYRNRYIIAIKYIKENPRNCTVEGFAQACGINRKTMYGLVENLPKLNLPTTVR
jgi:hypothetical protein